MVEEDLGQATIVYEDPDEGTVEKQVQNEYVAYFQDHWIVKTDEDPMGDDRIRRIPHNRVYYVERSVEEFEEEVTTLKHQAQNFVEDLRNRFMGGGSRGGEQSDQEPTQVDIGDGNRGTQESETPNQ